MFLLCFGAILIVGAIDIPIGEVMKILGGKEGETGFASTILLETRLPMAIAASCAGATLSVAGLLMQTLFQNPLAGPSVLGISSGASLSVAVLMLGATGVGESLYGLCQPFVSVLSALAGGVIIIIVLMLFSSILKNGISLLIVGLMLSYICDSGISLLNYFSPPEEIRSYLVWGMGSFGGLRLVSAQYLLLFSIVALIPCIFYIKPLNALLLGERYTESIGYSIKKLRGMILILTGFLVAVPTAYCGPISFIGLIVPHICRLIMGSSNHTVLLPGCILFGAITSLLCALFSVVPSEQFGVLPVNVITPFLGVPVILYLLINRHKLPYFS